MRVAVEALIRVIEGAGSHALRGGDLGPVPSSGPVGIGSRHSGLGFIQMSSLVSRRVTEREMRALLQAHLHPAGLLLSWETPGPGDDPREPIPG